MKNVAIVGFLSIFLTGCSLSSTETKQKDSPPVWQEIKVENVARIMMTEPYHYTVFVQQGGNEMLKKTYREGAPDQQGQWTDIRYFTDVPPTEAMWLKVVRYQLYGDMEKYGIVEMHVHSGKDIDGGPWTRTEGGKFKTTTQHQNVPIE